MIKITKIVIALREASVVFASDAEKPLWVITHESDVIDDYHHVISFCNRLIKHVGEPPFLVRHKNIIGTMRIPFIKSATLGKQFAQILRIDFSRLGRYYPCHDFHPDLAIVEAAMKERNLVGVAISEFEPWNLVPHVDRLNGCFFEIRKKLLTSMAKRKRDDFTRNARKNYSSLQKYLNDVVRAHASVMVSRAEFFYIKGDKWPNGTDLVGVDYETLRRHVTHLIKICNELPENYLWGYVFRLDHSLERGYVIHAMLLTNPFLSADLPEGVIKYLGQKWSELTEGKGVHYEYGQDIEYPQTSFKRCGTGRCDANNLENQAQLNDAALYLTMRDSFVRLKVPGRHRTLWRGITPKIPKKSPEISANTDVVPHQYYAQAFPSALLTQLPVT